MSGWADIDAFLAAHGLRFGAPTTAQTTGGSHVPGSLHYLGLARDYGSANSDIAGIVRTLLPLAQGPNAPITELFNSTTGTFYKNGQPITPSPELRQGHYDHVHVAIRPGALLTGSSSTSPAELATFKLGPVDTGIPTPGDVTKGIRETVLMGLFIVAGLALVVLGGVRGVQR